MEVSEYQEIVAFLRYGNYPYKCIGLEINNCERKGRKANFRAKCRLFKMEINNDGEVVSRRNGKIVLAKPFLNDILEKYHNNVSSSGHLGRDKTYKKVSSIYHWKKIKQDITDYVRKCEQCKRTNIKLKSECSELHPINVSKGCWRLVTIDLIGPLHKSKKGNKFIIVTTDNFSRWYDARAIPSKDVDEVEDFLAEIICKNGLMEHLDSYLSSELIKQCIGSLTSKLRINHRISCACHSPTQVCLIKIQYMLF